MTQIKEKLYFICPPPPTLKVLFERLKTEGYEILPIPESPLSEEQNIYLFPISNQTEMSDFNELLLSIKKNSSRSLVFGVYSGKLKYKLNELYQKGFQFIFQIPFEEELFLNKLFELVPVNISDDNLSLGQLIRVNILEIEKQRTSPFDIYLYLPSNRKIVHYVKENDFVDLKTIEKFKKNSHYNLYIKRQDLKKYNEFSQKLMSDIIHKSNLSESEKIKAVQQNLSRFMGPFFSEEELSEDESQQTISNLQQLLKGLESPQKESKALLEQVQTFASQKMTHQSHSQNVATYCSLFGISMGYFKPEALKIGGLLHDLGLTDLPSELLDKTFECMNEEEQARYKLHPGNGKQDILQKKMKIPEEAMEMILLHHERADGSGYPYGYKSEQIPMSARICAFADEFDKLTSVREGFRQLSPLQALEYLKESSVYEEIHFAKLYDNFLKSSPQNSIDKNNLSELQNAGKVLIKNSSKNLPIKDKTLIKIGAVSEKIQSTPVKHNLSPEHLSQPNVAELIEDLKKYFDELSQ